MKKVRVTKMLMPITTLIVCAIGLGTQFVRADTAIESFDYTAGSALIGQNGGTGWASAWRFVVARTTNSVIAAGSLTYPNVTSSGNKMTSVNTDNGDSRALRKLATSYDSGTVYFSTLIQNLNGSSRYLGLSLYTGDAEKTLLGQGSNFSKWTLAYVITNGVAGTLVSEVDSSQLSLLVLRIDFNASSVESSYENVTFWVNPDLSQPESAATAVGGQSYSTSKDLGTIDTIRVGGAALSGATPAPELYMDEVRVSTESPFATVLNIAVANSEAQLSWPAPGWTLQKASALGTAVTWIDITGTETITSTNLPVGEPVEFFRLYKEAGL